MLFVMHADKLKWYCNQSNKLSQPGMATWARSFKSLSIQALSGTWAFDNL